MVFFFNILDETKPICCCFSVFLGVLGELKLQVESMQRISAGLRKPPSLLHAAGNGDIAWSAEIWVSSDTEEQGGPSGRSISLQEAQS